MVLSSISAAESGITPFNFLYLLNIRNFSFSPLNREKKNESSVNFDTGFFECNLNFRPICDNLRFIFKMNSEKQKNIFQQKTVTEHTNNLYINEIDTKRLSPDCHQTITLLNENQKYDGDRP